MRRLSTSKPPTTGSLSYSPQSSGKRQTAYLEKSFSRYVWYISRDSSEYQLDHVGIRGCASAASDPERAPGSLHQQGPSARNQTGSRSQTLGRHRLRDLCSLPTPLHQPQHCGWNDLAHPAVPRLPPLSHQVLKSVYAVPHASSRFRVPESSEQGEDGGREYRKEDRDVRFYTLLSAGGCVDALAVGELCKHGKCSNIR